MDLYFYNLEVPPLSAILKRVYINLKLAAAMMATPALLARNSTQAFRRQINVISVQRRGLAAAASGSFQYETGSAAGVKFTSRDLPGPTTTLAVVARAGTRYQILPGYSDALEKFAFKVSARLVVLRTMCQKVNAMWRSQRSNAQVCELLGNRSYSAVSFLHTTPEKTSS